MLMSFIKDKVFGLHNQWNAKSIIGGCLIKGIPDQEVRSPSDRNDIVGHVLYASQSQLERSIESANHAFDEDLTDREKILKSLERAAELYEENQYELMSLAMREAGKTYQDATDEVREAVDFLRYYANLSRGVMPGQRKARGSFCLH